VGTFTNLFSCTFKRCTISDDATLSPTGVVYLAAGWLPDLGGGAPGVVFDACTWPLVNLGRGPITNGDVVYRDCTITTGAHATGAAIIADRLEGLNFFTGSFAIGSATMIGVSLVLNGVVQMRGSAVYDPPSLA